MRVLTVNDRASTTQPRTTGRFSFSISGFENKHGRNKPNHSERTENMKASYQQTTLAALLALALAPAPLAVGADSAERAAMVKEKIQTLRQECAQGRAQITQTLEALSRLTVAGVELRPQFEKYKAELAKMEEKARGARERAASMKEKGQAFFAEWEQHVKTIQNEDIRAEAEKRLAKRRKSYGKILSAMEEAREHLVPFMSDLNDIQKLLDSELSASTVASTKKLIRQANWHGEDVRESLSDVEKELDRVAAELAKYQ
jgi:chromosome segregation ATPase